MPSTHLINLRATLRRRLARAISAGYFDAITEIKNQLLLIDHQINELRNKSV